MFATNKTFLIYVRGNFWRGVCRNTDSPLWVIYQCPSELTHEGKSKLFFELLLVKPVSYLVHTRDPILYGIYSQRPAIFSFQLGKLIAVFLILIGLSSVLETLTLLIWHRHLHSSYFAASSAIAFPFANFESSFLYSGIFAITKGFVNQVASNRPFT